MTRPWRPRSLVARYSAASATWHDTIHRLGYLHAYEELIQRVGATLKSSLDTQLSADRTRAILDAGCGTGAFSLVFARWQRSSARLARIPTPPPHIDLLDPSPRMLTAAVERHRSEGFDARILCGTIDALPTGVARYDVVLCSHVLEHADNVHEALVRLHSVLVPGGTLLLVVSHPHWCTKLLQFKWGSASWRESEVFDMLRGAQFSALGGVRFSKGPPSRTSVGYVARKA
jgi:2-polyprenyl-3-methyl-5-hydroxy-6-metoxy-1,4-benzoquinol methylase